MAEQKIAIIGCGNLGEALLKGLLANGTPPENLIATKRHISSLKHYAEQGVTVTTDNAKAIKAATHIIVALKPYTILEVLAAHQALIDPSRHVVISVATGVSLKEIHAKVGEEVTIFRAMPNTAADVGESLTCICTDEKGSGKIKEIENIFNHVGTTVTIDEELMESATVLGACGVAFVLRFIRAMIQGGIEIGFDAKTASTIVNQTVKGASSLLIEGKNHPEHEIDKVTTPKGCTIVGLNEMEHNGFSSSLIKGIVTSFNKIER